MFRTVLRSSLSTTIRNVQRIPAARRSLTQQARAQLQTTVKSSPVVLFMKGTPAVPQCGFSRAVVQILELQGVPTEKLKTLDVLEDQSLRSDVKEFSDWPTVPQLYVDGEFVGGCDILLSMHQSGDLEKLLQEKNVITPSTKQADA